jgi:hypothetical protein
VEPEEMAVARQQPGKHISAATNTLTIIEALNGLLADYGHGV